MPAPLLVDVVVPARDADGTLGELLAGLPARAFRSVVVVDRGSRDRTAEVARDHGATVLRAPGGGYGAACQRALEHFQALPRVPDALVFIPGDRPSAAPALPQLIAPIADRSVELVLGIEGIQRNVAERVVVGLIDAVYRHRWSGAGPVRAVRFPALVALGMRDRGAGWDVEMLVRAVKLGLSCDEIPLPVGARHRARVSGRALLHILRHATMR